MSPSGRQQAAVKAEAAHWLARLHSGERTRQDIDEFQRWLQQDEEHRAAFEAATLSWDLAGSLTDIPRQTLHGPRRRAVLASACVIGVGGILGLHYAAAEAATTYTSDVGEIRHITLADGSRLTLDTASRVEVRFAHSRRRLNLVDGRAHLAVAKDPARPFSVDAADHQVIARGTVFEVALGDGTMQVLLTEGLVDVVSRTGETNALVPGQRLSYSHGAIRIDRPDPQKLLAWQSGRLIFDDDALGDAVTQMNRYDWRKIVLSDPSLASYRISGTYETGDTRMFAQSVGQLLGIGVAEHGDSIALFRAPGRTETRT